MYSLITPVKLFPVLLAQKLPTRIATKAVYCTDRHNVFFKVPFLVYVKFQSLYFGKRHRKAKSIWDRLNLALA